MEGPIATWYARNTRGEGRAYAKCARAVANGLAPGARVLEVAPGPGYLALEIAKLGDFRVTGLDVSRSFVRMARENARAAGLDVDFQQGDAAHLPFPAASFDAAVCRAAFKNFSDPLGALNELHRVLRPGAVARIYDLRRDAGPGEIDAEVARMDLSAVNRWLTKWTFRNMLCKRAFGDAELRELCARSRFGKGELAADGIEFELRLAR